MSAATLLAELDALGVKVWPDAGAFQISEKRYAGRMKQLRPSLALVYSSANDESNNLLTEQEAAHFANCRILTDYGLAFVQ